MIVEGLMEIGEWSLTLSPETPKSVRDAISTPFAHVAITPARVDPARVGDAGMLATARYVGVVTRPGPQYEIGGHGLAWWMGDADRNGPVETSLFVLVGNTFEFSVDAALYMTAPLGPPIDTGTVEALGGSYEQTCIYLSVREVISAICASFGAEWRVNPDFTLDAGTAAYLFGSTPAAVLVKHGGGKEIVLPGFDGDMGAAVDYSEYANRVVLLSGSGLGRWISTSAISTGWLDPHGNTFFLKRLYDGSDIPEDQQEATADALLAVHEVVAGRREIGLSSSSYDIRGTVSAGSVVSVYDADIGLVDLANEARYGGSLIWPQEVRVTRLTWPVEAGMGVYYRRATAAGVFSYVDLSDYVEFEPPGAQIEIVAGSDRGTPLSTRPRPTAVDLVQDRPWYTYTPAWTSSGTAPSLGNGAIVGGYRRTGSSLHFRGQLTVGSTSTVGTGHLRVSLPSGLTGTATQIQAACPAWWYDASIPAVYPGTGLLEAGLGYVNFVFDGRAENRFPSSAVASGDILGWGGTVELDT